MHTCVRSRVRRWAKPIGGYRAGLKQKKQKVPKEAEFELRNWGALGLARTPCKKYRETPSDTRRVRLCVTWGLSVFVTWAPVAAEARPIRTARSMRVSSNLPKPTPQVQIPI